MVPSALASLHSAVARPDAGPDTVVLLCALLMALECSVLIGLLVPADAIVLVTAGTLPNWGSRLALVFAVVIGSLVGELLGYLAGRLAGARIRHCWAGRKLGAARWVRVERVLHERGPRSIIALRFVAVVHAITPVVAGTFALPLRRYLAWSAFASTLWAVIVVTAGTTAGTALARFETTQLLLPALAVATIAAWAGVRRLPHGGDETPAAGESEQELDAAA